MASFVIDYRVFIASPTGLEAERRAFKATITEHNELNVYDRTAVFSPVGWQLTLPGRGRPQRLINEDLQRCDFFLLLLSDRWGTPPDKDGRYSSGCEEEFSLAERCIADPTQPMLDIAVFFKKLSQSQMSDPGPQLQKVLEFRNRLVSEKTCLFSEYSSVSEFQLLLRRLLVQWTQAKPPRQVKINASMPMSVNAYVAITIEDQYTETVGSFDLPFNYTLRDLLSDIRAEKDLGPTEAEWPQFTERGGIIIDGKSLPANASMPEAIWLKDHNLANNAKMLIVKDLSSLH